MQGIVENSGPWNDDEIRYSACQLEIHMHHVFELVLYLQAK